MWAGCYSFDCTGRVMTICSNRERKKKEREKKTKKQKNVTQRKTHLVGGLLFL